MSRFFRSCWLFVANHRMWYARRLDAQFREWKRGP